MACQEMYLWTFTGLVGSFLDLAIVYLLLCASAAAFFASKFLGIFGLSLPCPCAGLFGNPSRNLCVQRLLVDCPAEKTSNVQISVKTKFPFNSIWGSNDQNRYLNMDLGSDQHENSDGFYEFEGEASCSSLSDLRMSEKKELGHGKIEIGGVISSSDGLNEKKRFDWKGKGVSKQRGWVGLRRRRRKSRVDFRNFLSFSCDEPPSAENEDSEANEGTSSANLDLGISDASNQIQYDAIAPLRSSRSFELLDEIKNAESSFGDQVSNPNEKNAIRVLEQALEEEHAARAALYLELEKERSAAASAADEAMAMILRLQEEKGSIEMEARQYQRIIEEKSAYDIEEMNILKEIIMRREREKHFLEKELESYKSVFNVRNEVFEGENGEMMGLSLDSNGDPIMMLYQISKSIEKREMLKNRGLDQGSDGDREKQLSQGPICNNDKNEGVLVEEEEKEKTIAVDDRLKDSQEQNANSDREIPIKSIEICNEPEIPVHDVHVIGDRPSSSGLEPGPEIKRGNSEMTGGLPPIGPRAKSRRRNSLSAIDNERLKLDSEIVWLRERLRIVQEGRGKLNLSVEHREREAMQLQLLEDIARQLREIRQLTAPGKAVRLASVPPPSSKVMSKKRRCRSLPLVQKSS